MSKERRKALRIPARLDVHIKRMDVFLKEQSSNISAGGIFIETEEKIPEGSLVQILLYLPYQDREIGILVEGEVMHLRPASGNSPAGIGLRFKSFSAEDQRTLLEDLVQHLEAEGGY